MNENYLDGYNTGLNWHENFRPGGPYVFIARPGDKPSWIKICEESRKANKDWLDGFDEGWKKQKEDLTSP